MRHPYGVQKQDLETLNLMKKGTFPLSYLSNMNTVLKINLVVQRKRMKQIARGGETLVLQRIEEEKEKEVNIIQTLDCLP